MNIGYVTNAIAFVLYDSDIISFSNYIFCKILTKDLVKSPKSKY